MYKFSVDIVIGVLKTLATNALQTNRSVIVVYPPTMESNLSILTCPVSRFFHRLVHTVPVLRMVSPHWLIHMLLDWNKKMLKYSDILLLRSSVKVCVL